MNTPLDKIFISEAIQDFNYCPHCQETLIEDTVSQVVQDDYIEEATQYACDISTLCKGCRADEESDNNRM